MSSTPIEPPAPAPRPVIPRAVWVLGVVSLLTDVSSEMIFGLLPVFLVSVLGATTTTVGLIEGIAEGTASVSKLFSGWLSDRMGQRKALTVIGYGLSALSKPLFAIAGSASTVLGARFADRVGKGIRGAPRDALIGDLVPAGSRGAAYGLRQALDTVGAFVGPLTAIGLMAALNDDFRRVFWLAVIPGVLSVLVLIIGVREPEPTPSAPREPLRLRECRSLGRAYWAIVAVGAVLTLAGFSQAFLILRAQAAGLPLALAPLVLVVMNIVYAGSAYPLGALSDRVNRRQLLALGFATLIAADLILAWAPSLWVVMTGVAVWGLYLGMTQGLLAALVADAAPANLRASAFGAFNFASGIALVVASVLAGLLWAHVGPSATFIAGAVLAALGISLLLLIPARSSPAIERP